MIQKVVLSKNSLFFCFLLLGYVFGVIFYDFLGFDYTDELMALFLAIFAGVTVYERKNINDLYPLMILIGIFIFYTVYSFVISSNIPQAILKDFAIQIKPFLAFYCALLIAPVMSERQRQITSILCLIMGGIMLGAIFSNNIEVFFVHHSRLATSATVTALLFLYCSSFKWSDIIIFILLLSIGFFSTRSKFYGFWGIALCLILYYKVGGIIKFNVKSIVVGIVIICLGILLSWKKIVVYYIDGAMTSEQMWSRPAMMVTAVRIFEDYFPFGSGLGSFGTSVSGEYYSKMYAKYGIDMLWGITKDNFTFIADAYYPELAQFGVIGAIIYFIFWGGIIHKAVGKREQMIPQKMQLFLLLIPTFFFIEGIADATLVSNRGVFMMILLGMVIANRKKLDEM